MVDKQPIVVMKGITIEFPGVKALDGVDLRLYPGEVHALMGEKIDDDQSAYRRVQDQRGFH